MMLKVLTPNHVEQFIEEGFTILRGAFPRAHADAVRKFIVERTGAREDDPATWTRRGVHLPETFSDDMFMRCYSERFHAALDDLMGEGRWIKQTEMGWWPVVFPGFDKQPWQPPTVGWHVDGQHFHHHLDSPEQGMLPILLFNDIEPGDGGTAVAPGSHFVTARSLYDAQPHGLDCHQVSVAAREAIGRVVEVQGEAGDIALLHPFMLHAQSANTGKRIRVICNPAFKFRERMNVSGDPSRPISAVERAIIRGTREGAPASVGTRA